MSDRPRKKAAPKKELHDRVEHEREKVLDVVSAERDELERRNRLDEVEHAQGMDSATKFKAAGLLAFLVLMVVIVVLAWPYMADIFTEGGVDRLVTRVRDAGPLGVLMLLGLQFLQIVVAFIPGEVVQVAAGMMYGPVWGSLIILVGCVISSGFIYLLVHRLGAPFVQAMVPIKYLEKFRTFEANGRLGVTVFILFLIPGLPKDVFTYLVPLTDMKLKPFLILTSVARIPGIVLSTTAATGLADGNYTLAVILFGIAAVLAVLAIVFRARLMDALSSLEH